MNITNENPFWSPNGVFIIAEIGGNHEGNYEYAKKLTCLAAETGADAVKFQIYTGESLVNPLEDPARVAHFNRFAFTKDQYIGLAKLCSDLNISFMASVWEESALDYIDPYIKIYKIGSGDLTAVNLIKNILKRKKPVILSTGLSTLCEVEDTVAFIEKIDPSFISERKLALLQCSTMYPIPDEDANLNTMMTLRAKTGLFIGYSDHTIGMNALMTSVSMGAEIVEVHFTDSRENRTFRDHQVSATKDELIEFISNIKKIIILKGSFEKAPVKSEIAANHLVSFRRAVFPSKDLDAGTIVREEDLLTLRPCVGIPATEFYNLIGMRLKVNVKKYQRLAFEMFA